MFRHILVPVEGSELSSGAAKRACAFAREVGARLTFYHAKPALLPALVSGEPVLGGMTAPEDLRAAWEGRAQAILEKAAQAAQDAGVSCATLSTESDSPYEGIIAAAESQGCDLIFMSSHGRRGASALLLGSETQKVLTHCKIPVLVYR
jgi:nucleotide-binding universal stress UspA family protein